MVRSRQSWWCVVGIGVTAVALLFDLPLSWSAGLAFLMLFVWPTLTWRLWLRGSGAEQLVAGAGLVLAMNVLVGLLLVYLPGAVERPLSLLIFTLLALLPCLFGGKYTRAFPSFPALSAQTMAVVALIGLAALFFRLTNLSYSEFQGDEGTILMRAAAMITGDEAEIFLHQKGPVEILLPLSLWTLAGSINEFWARLPFAWASLWALAAVMLLARRWFDRFTGLLAGSLFVLVGFAIAFGRIVQYQSLVMVWSALALWQASRFVAEERRSDLWLTAVFLAAGLLAHYDVALTLPAIGWLLLGYLWRKRQWEWGAWGVAAALGLLILAVFYIPFALNPNFARTGRYLLQDRVGAGEGQGIMSWSGTAVWQMVTFYNSLYFIMGLATLLLVGVWLLWRRKQQAVALLYFAVPFLFYLFIVVDPRTHVYTFFPGAVILAAVGAAAIWQKVSHQSQLKWAAAALFALFWLVSAAYVYLMFIDTTPERQRTWAENRPAFYPTTWAEPPLYGVFGFPHQAGWRIVRPLLKEDAFPYASNEEREVTNWYMVHAPRTHCPNFETFMLAADTKDEIPYDPAWLESLNVQAEVVVNGRSSLQIYSHLPVDAGQTYEAAGSQHWLTPAQAAPPSFSGVHPVNIVLGDQVVALLGYDLDDSRAYPGGQLVVTLYWRPLVPFDENYQTFVHLYDGELRAQHDGAPECAINPTTRWEPGQIIIDPHIVPLPLETPVGELALLAGMYNLLTEIRLAPVDSSTDTIHLDDITIRQE